MTNQPTLKDARTRENGNRSLLIVGGGLVLVAVLAGVQGTRLFLQSEKYMKTALPEIHAQGASLNMEGCVDATLAAHAKCEGMASLCDSSTYRLLVSCLEAPGSKFDRHSECEALGTRPEDTHFGFPECKARGATSREAKKTCGNVYRGIDRFCARLRKDGMEERLMQDAP